MLSRLSLHKARAKLREVQAALVRRNLEAMAAAEGAPPPAGAGARAALPPPPPLAAAAGEEAGPRGANDEEIDIDLDDLDAAEAAEVRSRFYACV